MFCFQCVRSHHFDLCVSVACRNVGNLLEEYNLTMWKVLDVLAVCEKPFESRVPTAQSDRITQPCV